MGLRSWCARAPRVAAIALGAALAGACEKGPPPHRFTVPPLTPEELVIAGERAEDELERWTRERDELLQEACDPGELAEHTRRTTQAAIDAKQADIPKIFRQGEALFERNFTRREGLGTGLTKLPAPGFSRVENAASLGGPDAMSCRECHGRGGDDGHGEMHHRAWLDGDGRHLNTAKPRVPPHVAGLGPIQSLAAEMTADLAAQVTSARTAIQQGAPEQTITLTTKGVDFGKVVVHADGSLDTSGVRGVDPDLVIKPFGWKGVDATLRAFVRKALPQHMGMDPLPLPSEPLAALAAPPGEAPTFATIAANAYLFDRDKDGHAGEIAEGQLTSLVAYLALLDVPVVLPPRNEAAYAAWTRGGKVFREIGCASCHVPELPLRAARWVERLQPSEEGLSLNLIDDSQVRPRLAQFDKGRSELPVALFSDLRRHDMGPGLAERTEAGVGPTVFLTRPLWGVADRAFFLHDGRARTFAEAIRLHGGEAENAAHNYADLPAEPARDLEVFLLALRRFPQGRLAP